MEHWYVLHTKTSAERQVAILLEERDVETFLPMATVKPKVQKRAPLFPGYIFARFDLASGKPANWKWIPGLRYLVAYGDNAVPVPEEVIRLIAHKARELDEAKAKPAFPFKQGDIVRVKDGPFADMLAIFDKACTPSKRVQILLQSLDRSYKLKIETDRIEKAPDHLAKEFKKKRPRRTRGRGRRIKR